MGGKQKFWMPKNPKSGTNNDFTSWADFFVVAKILKKPPPTYKFASVRKAQVWNSLHCTALHHTEIFFTALNLPGLYGT